MAKQKKKSVRTPSRNGRLTADAWVAAGLDLLAHGGIDAVRIDQLARVLGVTKGSFYWHFEERADLLAAMLEMWRRSATLAVIERLETHGSPAERLRRLLDLPLSGNAALRGQSLELAIRLWSRRDQTAAAAIEEIDQQRLAYTMSLLRANGVSESKAGAAAYLIYAFVLAEALIPAKATARVASRETLREAVEEIVRDHTG